ncbi:MAG: hypothetical protein EXS31_17020 [Pedosphaera sp.]|nr:hypothetical protein [Pedosphaera sp.]
MNPGPFGAPFSDNGRVPDGGKVAFIQENSALKQTVRGLVAGVQYFLRFHENARTCCAAPRLAVTIGGVAVVSEHAVPPVGGDNPYRLLTSSPFTADAANVELAFIKSDPTGSDSTVLLDAVELLPVGQYEWSMNEGDTVTMRVSTSDGDLPAQKLAFALAAGAPEASVISPEGVFRWTPTEAQGPGKYPITVRVTDNGEPPLSAEQTFTVTVNEVNTAPKLSVISDQSAEVGRELAFAATAADADLPANALIFSLNPGAADGAKISTTGAFTWTPTEAQGGATYPIGITATDDGVPPLNDSKKFNVTVAAVQREIRVTGASISGDGKFTFTWSAQAGRSYQVQFKNGLSDAEWRNIEPPVTTTTDSATFTASVSDGAQRYYRVVGNPQ